MVWLLLLAELLQLLFQLLVRGRSGLWRGSAAIARRGGLVIACRRTLRALGAVSWFRREAIGAVVTALGWALARSLTLVTAASTVLPGTVTAFFTGLVGTWVIRVVPFGTISTRMASIGAAPLGTTRLLGFGRTPFGIAGLLAP